MTLTVVWSTQARDQLVATLRHIADTDPMVAEKVHQRVQKAITLLCASPTMGVPAPTAGVRTYAVPNTGHSFDYRLVHDQIRIQRWYRQRQRPDPADLQS
jgi:plasmid stabilization system protein ParE